MAEKRLGNFMVVALWVIVCSCSSSGPSSSITPNLPDLSYLFSAVPSEDWKLNVNFTDEYTVSLSLPSSATTSIPPATSPEIIFQLGTGEVNFSIPFSQTLHLITGDPDGAKIQIYRRSYLYWEGSSGPGPYVDEGSFTLRLLEEANTISPFPAVIAGYFPFRPPSWRLWVLRDSFAYPVGVLSEGMSSYSFHIPPVSGKYAFFISRGLFPGEFIIPSDVITISDAFEVTGETGVKGTLELYWLNHTDLDLHVLPEGGTALGGNDDCYFVTQRTPWGCVFIADNSAGFGNNLGGEGFGSPEVLSLRGVKEGSFSVYVDAYDLRDLYEEWFFIVYHTTEGSSYMVFSPISRGQRIKVLKLMVRSGQVTAISPDF